ncbi:MAG: hypothetical protein B6240_00690 [Desulfobacteraceae bacterium 4572_87]|nr:MAG: hypothetical protein B6240_00690 [Desulfobacteraceae bacterium 4572_87]
MERIHFVLFPHARVWQPKPKVSVTVDLDVDVLEWFKVEADDWQSRIQTALRLYVEANKAYLKSQGSKIRNASNGRHAATR